MHQCNFASRKKTRIANHGFLARLNLIHTHRSRISRSLVAAAAVVLCFYYLFWSWSWCICFFSSFDFLVTKNVLLRPVITTVDMFHWNSERTFFSPAQKKKIALSRICYTYKHTLYQQQIFRCTKDSVSFPSCLASERWASLLWAKRCRHNVVTIMDHGSRKIIVREQDSWCGKTEREKNHDEKKKNSK